MCEIQQQPQASSTHSECTLYLLTTILAPIHTQTQGRQNVTSGPAPCLQICRSEEGQGIPSLDAPPLLVPTSLARYMTPMATTCCMAVLSGWLPRQCTRLTQPPAPSMRRGHAAPSPFLAAPLLPPFG